MGLVVACSGFPIAVSRYLQEFMAVEISDTEIGIPGTGTVRRWLRESPEGFVFTALAPSQIGAAGFAATDEVTTARDNIIAFCDQLSPLALVFRVPPDVTYNKSMLDAFQKLVDKVDRDKITVVLDAPGFKAVHTARMAEAAGAICATDPLTSKEVPSGAIGYLILPGPAGHRSRYDEAALDQIAEACRSSEAETTICVFRNIDMEANAKSLRTLLGV